MKISEIEKGSDLVVKVFPKVMKDGVEIRSMRSLDFAVNVQKVYATAIAVDEIKTTSVPAPGGKQGDKKDKGMATVSFQSTKAFVDLYLFEDDTAPVVWENVIIKHARGDKGPCHVIMASKDGVKMNRRHAYRLDVHAPANISIGRDRTSQIQGIVTCLQTDLQSLRPRRTSAAERKCARRCLTRRPHLCWSAYVCASVRCRTDGSCMGVRCDSIIHSFANISMRSRGSA